MKIGIFTKPLLYMIGKGCPYCGTRMDYGPTHNPTRDHIIPVSRNGSRYRGNTVVVCRRCNQDKRNLTIYEFLKELRHQRDIRVTFVLRFIRNKNIPRT